MKKYELYVAKPALREGSLGPGTGFVLGGGGGPVAVAQKSLLLLVTDPTCTLPNSPQTGRRSVREPGLCSGVCVGVGSAPGIERRILEISVEIARGRSGDSN